MMESAVEFLASNETRSEIKPTCDDLEVSKEAVQEEAENTFNDQVENSVENEKTDVENQLDVDQDLSYATSSDRNYFNSTTLTLNSSTNVVNDFEIVLEKMHSLGHLAVSEENNTEMDDGLEKMPITEKSACDAVEVEEVLQLGLENEENPQPKGNDSKEIVNPETKSNNSTGTTSLHFCDHCDKKYTVERSLSRHKKKCHKTLVRKQSHLGINDNRPSRMKGIVPPITPSKDESKDTKEITKRISLRLPKPKVFDNYVSEVTRTSRSTSKPLKEIDELKACNEETSHAKRGSTETKLDKSLKPYSDEASMRLSKSKTNIETGTSENATALWRSTRIRKPKLKDFFPKETTKESRPPKRKLEAKTDQENVSEKSLSGKRLKRSELESYSQSTNGIKKNTNVDLKETNVLKDNETKNNERNLKNGDIPRVTDFNMRGFSLRRSVRGPSMKFRRYETHVENKSIEGARSKKLSGKMNPQALDGNINDSFRRVSNRAVKPAKFNEYIYATDSRMEGLPSIRKDLVKKVETPLKLVSKEGKNTPLKLPTSKRKNTTNKNRNLKTPTLVLNRIRKPKMLADFVYSSNQNDDTTSEKSISQKNLALDKRKTSKIEANAGHTAKVKNFIPINATSNSLVTKGVKQSKAIDRSINKVMTKSVKLKLNQKNTQPFKVKTAKIKKTDSLIANGCPGGVSDVPKKRGRPRKPINIEEILAKIKSQASRRKIMNASVTQRAFEVVKFESKSQKSTSRKKSHNRAYTKELLKDPSRRRNCTDSLPAVKHAVARKSNPYQYRYFYDINMVKPMSIVIPKLDEVTFRKMLNKI